MARQKKEDTQSNEATTTAAGTTDKGYTVYEKWRVAPIRQGGGETGRVLGWKKDSRAALQTNIRITPMQAEEMNSGTSTHNPFALFEAGQDEILIEE